VERRKFNDRLGDLKSQVSAQERSGIPNLPAHQILSEIDWLRSSTHDFPRMLERVGALEEAVTDPADFRAGDAQSPVDGSWGKWFTEWAFKLNASYSNLSQLEDRNEHPKYPLHFLDRINSPAKLTAHLNSLLTSDMEADGVDRRPELNMTVGALVRLVPWSKPKEYAYDPKLKDALADWLIQVARNPETGYWGERYREKGSIRKTDDFGLTYDIVTNLRGEIPDWDKVVDTTLAIKDTKFGWMRSGKYSNRGNAQVVEMLALGWKRVSPARQTAIRAEVHRMLDWCLEDSLLGDGSFAQIRENSPGSAAYSGASFLAETGYFNRSRRFWTDEDFPGSESDRQRITAFIKSHIGTGGDYDADYRRALELIAPTPGDNITLVEDVTYLVPSRAEKLDLFLPSRTPQDPPSPAVIWIHGNNGDKANPREREICEVLSSAGYVSASINYGPWGSWFFGTFRRNIADAKNAVRFLRVHAAEYHIDPSRIAVFGGSAGANLALMTGLTAGDAEFEPSEPYSGVSSAVNVIGDFYGASDYSAFKQPSLVGAAIRRLFLSSLRSYSPVNRVTSASPSVFIAHGRDDPLVDYRQSVELDQVLSAKGVPHEFILMDHVGHGFDLTTWDGHPLPRDLRPTILSFLNEYLGPAVHGSAAVTRPAEQAASRP